MTPPDIRAAALATVGNLLPEKSQTTYRLFDEKRLNP
jgi:hypothetical protein